MTSGGFCASRGTWDTEPSISPWSSNIKPLPVRRPPSIADHQWSYPKEGGGVVGGARLCLLPKTLIPPRPKNGVPHPLLFAMVCSARRMEKLLQRPVIWPAFPFSDLNLDRDGGGGPAGPHLRAEWDFWTPYGW